MENQKGAVVKSIVEFWSTHRLGKNGFIIQFPVVNEEQVKRCRYWRDYVESCSVLRITPNKKEFEKIYCPQEPDGVA